MCSSNVTDVPNLRPKFFIDETCLNDLLLKNVSRCTNFLTLQVKITSYVCWDGSKLITVIQRKVDFFILYNFSQSILAILFTSSIIVNN